MRNDGGGGERGHMTGQSGERWRRRGGRSHDRRWRGGHMTGQSGKRWRCTGRSYDRAEWESNGDNSGGHTTGRSVSFITCGTQSGTRQEFVLSCKGSQALVQISVKTRLNHY